MQSKLFKRILTGVLSAALVITSANFAPEQTEAAKKVKSLTISTQVGGETVEISKKDEVPVQIVAGGSKFFQVDVDGAGSFKVKSKNKAIKAKKTSDGAGFDVSGADGKRGKLIVTSTKKNKKGKKIKVPFFVKITEIEAATALNPVISASTIKIGDTATITPNVEPATIPVAYTTSDATIATVSDAGVVTAVAEGTATITVTAGGLTKTVSVTVTKEDVPEPEPEELALDSVEGAQRNQNRGTNVIVAYFSAPTEFAATDVEIREVSNNKLFTIESVTFTSDKKTATMALTGTSSAGTAAIFLADNTNYNLIVKIGGKTYSKVFYIPAVADDVVVTSVDPAKKTINTLKWSNSLAAINTTTGKYTVPDDMVVDYAGLVGETVTIKYDRTTQIESLSTKENEKVIFGAFKAVTPTSGSKYLQEVVSEDKYYVQESGTAAIPASVEAHYDDWNAGWTFYGTDGTAAAGTGWPNAGANEEFKYGKLVLNSNGTIKTFLHLSKWTGQMIVKETKDNSIVGVNNQEQTLKDYTILKDGDGIKVADIAEGDVVFFNTTYKLAEVYNDSKTAALDAVYDGGKFKFDGKDRDGSSASYYDGTSVKTVDTDYLKALKAAGKDITVYYDRSKTPVFVIGDQGTAVTTKTTLVLTAQGDGYATGKEYMIDIEGFDGTAKVTKTITVSKLKTIKFFGTGANEWKSSLGTISASAYTAGKNGETIGFNGTAPDAALKVNDTTAGAGDAHLCVGAIVEVTADKDDVITAMEIKRAFVGAPDTATADTVDNNEVTFDDKVKAADRVFKKGWKTVTIVGAAPISAANFSDSTNVYVVNKNDGTVSVTKTAYKDFAGTVANANIGKVAFYTNDGKTAITDVVIDNQDKAALGVDTDGAKTVEAVISDIQFLDGKISKISVINGKETKSYDKFGDGTGLKNTALVKGNIVDITVLKDGETVQDVVKTNAAAKDGTGNPGQFYGVVTTGDGKAYTFNTASNTNDLYTEYAFEATTTITKLADGAVSVISLSDLEGLALTNDVTFSLKEAGSTTVDTIVVGAGRSVYVGAALKAAFATAGTSTAGKKFGGEAADSSAVFGTVTGSWDPSAKTGTEVTTLNTKALYTRAVNAKKGLDILINDYNKVNTDPLKKFDANNTDANATNIPDYVKVYKDLTDHIDSAATTLIVGAAAIADITVTKGTDTQANWEAVSKKLPTSVHVVLANGTEKDITVKQPAVTVTPSFTAAIDNWIEPGGFTLVNNGTTALSYAFNFANGLTGYTIEAGKSPTVNVVVPN